MSEHQISSAARFFGEFQLILDGREITAWRAGKARALFQYLHAHRNQAISRDRLREALWPHLPPSAGATSVKAAAHGARRVLRTSGLANGAAPAEICSVAQGYRLRTDGLWSDVEAFTRQLATAAAAARSGDRTTAVSCYRSAVRTYRGPFLASDDADWVVDQREWFRTQALRALRYLCDDAIDDDDHWTAIEWAHRAIQVDPYDQRAYQVLARSHRHLGLTAQARRWDHLCEVRLADA